MSSQDISSLSDVAFVIAAYNEGSVIGNVVAELVDCSPRHVIVVDDGSVDGTASSARQFGAFVVRHPLNLGQGAALQTGFETALRLGCKYAVSFDADGQHRVEDAVAMLRTIRDAGCDVVLGSRFIGGESAIPPGRRMLLRAATLFTRVTTGMRVTDSHNGLRVLSAKALGAIHLRQNRMAHASEILQQIASSGLTYVEAPVTIRYTEYSLHKGQKASGAIAILYDLFAARFSK